MVHILVPIFNVGQNHGLDYFLCGYLVRTQSDFLALTRPALPLNSATRGPLSPCEGQGTVRVAGRQL